MNQKNVLGAGMVAALLLAGAVRGGCQAKEAAPIVQPGAPGQNSKVLPGSTVAPPQKPTEADVKFMQGMVMHHGQAVEMTELLRTRGENKEVLALGRRIGLSQTDEMKFMRQWLERRGLPVESMAPMDHSHMSAAEMGTMDMSAKAMPLMPGMLSAQQMEALRKSRGAEFDHLFLTGMIQHHGGALVMVRELFESPAGGQDADLFDFATDVDNTQRAEIGLMQGMLEKEKR